MQIQTINPKTNKIKRVEETNTPKLFIRFDPNWPTNRRKQLFHPLLMSLCKRYQKSYNKLTS